jgi:Xaa-Pro aminopeptidase
MDVGGEYSLYAADITRTAPVNGKFTPRQREIYNIVLGALEAAAAAVVPGKSTFTRKGEHSIYNTAFEYINTHGKDLHGQPLGRYFTHGISHYIGLDVHDAGTPAPLEPGMVFSIEPGIYIPEERIGVRIEDMFWIDPQAKLVNLTKMLARTADEIEQAMHGGNAHLSPERSSASAALKRSRALR